MAAEKKFIKKALTEYAVKEYLEKELDRAGVSKIELQKTPIATRIAIHVRRPGVVVGKRGKTIQQVNEVLQQRYGIENPQLEVIEVGNPSLDAKLVAERVAHQIEIRGNAKRVARFALQEAMEAGAIGAEIRIAGKIVGKGGKAKVVKARAGYLKKSGEPVKLVQKGRYVAYPKAGAIGVTVKIVPPGTVFPDQVVVPELKLPETPAPLAGAPAGEGAVAAEAGLPPAEEKALEQKLEAAKEAKVKRVRKKTARKEVSEAAEVAAATGSTPQSTRPTPAAPPAPVEPAPAAPAA
jgi:small subunit ribosomal protein S3